MVTKVCAGRKVELRITLATHGSSDLRFWIFGGGARVGILMGIFKILRMLPRLVLVLLVLPNPSEKEPQNDSN